MTMSGESVRRVWNTFFYTGFSGESLGLLRLYLGWGLFFFHITQFENLLSLKPTGAHFYFLDRVWYFTLFGIDAHVPLLSFVLFVVLMIATLTMALGKWTRTSIIIVIFCIFYLQGARDSLTGDIHHRYFVPIHALFLLLLSDCGRVHAVDERENRGQPPLAEWEASWPIKTMQLYCVCFYFWSLLAKLRVSGWVWFVGEGRIQEVLVRRSAMWGTTEDGAMASNSLAFYLAQHHEVLFALGALTFIIEAGFPVILLIRQAKWRLVFLLAVTCFHLANFVLLYVGFVLSPIAFLIFFDLVPVHAWLQRSYATLSRSVRREPSPSLERGYPFLVGKGEPEYQQSSETKHHK